MPTGTTVDVVAEDNTDKNELSCTAELWSGNPTVASVFNLLTPSTFVNSSQVNYSYRLKGCGTGDSLILSVTAPNGKITKDEFKLFKTKKTAPRRCFYGSLNRNYKEVPTLTPTVGRTSIELQPASTHAQISMIQILFM